MEVSEEPDLDSSKDDLALGHFTPGETPDPQYGAFLSLPTIQEKSLLPLVKSLSTLAKKPYYVIILAEKAEPKKKIIGDVREQNIVIRKRIKKQLKAYTGFIAD